MFVTSTFIGQISSIKFHNVVHSSYLFKNNNIQHRCQLFLLGINEFILKMWNENPNSVKNAQKMLKINRNNIWTVMKLQL